jgi:hypothetical protein
VTTPRASFFSAISRWLFSGEDQKSGAASSSSTSASRLAWRAKSKSLLQLVEVLTECVRAVAVLAEAGHGAEILGRGAEQSSPRARV